MILVGSTGFYILIQETDGRFLFQKSFMAESAGLASVLGTQAPETLVLYPNAVSDVLHLSDVADHLRLYDGSGRLLATLEGVCSVDFRSYPCGRYVVDPLFLHFHAQSISLPRCSLDQVLASAHLSI